MQREQHTQSYTSVTMTAVCLCVKSIGIICLPCYKDFGNSEIKFSNLPVFALACGKQSGVRKVKMTLCFSCVTQHHVNQANIRAQGVILTIWSNMTGWAAPMLKFLNLRYYSTAGLMHPTETLEEMAEMCDDNVFLLVMGLWLCLHHTAS